MGREMVAWNLPGVRLARKERCLPPGWMLQMQIHEADVYANFCSKSCDEWTADC